MRKGYFFFIIACIFSLISACQKASNTTQVLAQAQSQIMAANEWTSRAARELDNALRDTLTHASSDTLLSNRWLDSLRVVDVIISDAQNRLETDMLVLDRLLEGKKERETGDIIEQYWASDDRLNKLSAHFIDAYSFMFQGRSDSIIPYASSNSAYWNPLPQYTTPAHQWAVLEGASLDLNTAYLDWLEGFRQHFGLPAYPENKLRMAIAPRSRRLLAGETFVADVWLSQTADLPPITYRGTGINQDSSWANEAQVSILAGSDSMPDKRRWNQKIHVEGSFFNDNGQQQQFFIHDSFEVVRPAIRWYGQQPAYLNCEHRIQVEAPLLGEAFIPSFETQGGSIEAVQDSAWFSLVPKDQVLHLDVFQVNGTHSVLLDTFHFNIVQAPRPRIVLLVNGQPHTSLISIPKRSRLVLQVLGAPDFERQFPGDAQYGMDAVEVLIQQKPDAPPRSILKFNGKGRSGSQGVPILLDETPVPLPPGTVLYIRAEGLFRRNFQGKFFEETRFNERERTVAVVLR